MTRNGSRALIVTGLLAIWLLGNSLPSPAVSQERTTVDGRVVSLRTVSGDAIGLKLRMDKPAAQNFESGDRVAVTIEPTERAYLIVVAVDPTGDVNILFPNRNHPDPLVVPEKTYVLFEPNTSMRLTLGEKVRKAGLTFYLSSKPVDLKPLAVPDGQSWLKIPERDQKSLKSLDAKLKLMAKDKRFARYNLSFTADRESFFDLMLSDCLVAACTNEAFYKGGLGPSSGPTSEDPQALTGAQGLKIESSGTVTGK